MRSLAVIAALWFVAASSLATAQVQVAAQTTRTNFLLYERVDLLVTVTNIGENDLVLNNDEGHPWLSFILTRHSQANYVPVRQERDSTFAQLSLKAGKSKTLRINLTPLFAFREEGEYRAAAVVDLPGAGQIISDNVPFNVAEGRKIWTQMRSVDGSQRIYSLIRFSPDVNTTSLYLRVEEPSDNLVYTNLSLGDMISFVDPDAFFDPQGNLHVLHNFSMGTYLYTRTNPDGKIVNQTIFKTFREVRPQLHKLADGNIVVVGGLQEDPNSPHEKLSDSQAGQVVKKADEPTAPPPGTVQ